DPYRRFQLRRLGRGYRALHQGHGDAEPGHRQGGVASPTAGVRSGIPLAVRDQHRVDGPPRRGDERADSRGLFPRADLQSARHEGQWLRHEPGTARTPGAATHTPARRLARCATAGAGAGESRVLVSGRPALLDGARLHRVPANAAEWRQPQWRADPEAGDRRVDEPEPHGQYPVRRAQGGDARSVERRQLLPRRGHSVGPRLHDEFARRAQRPQCRHVQLGWPLQHVLLARSSEEGRRPDHDSDPAVRRYEGREALWPTRGGSLRIDEIGLATGLVMTTKTAQQSVEMILVRQLASYLFVPVLVFDTTGTVIFYNEPAERILGVRFEETGRIDREEV